MKHVKRSDIEKPRILFLFIKTHEVYNTHWYTQSIFTITVSNAQSWSFKLDYIMLLLPSNKSLASFILAAM